LLTYWYSLKEELVRNHRVLGVSEAFPSMTFCVAAITEACSEVIDAGLLPSMMKLLATTFDVKKEVCLVSFG